MCGFSGLHQPDQLIQFSIAVAVQILLQDLVLLRMRDDQAGTVNHISVAMLSNLHPGYRGSDILKQGGTD
ncbi:hypothetical protein D3C75_1303780 [compost metagenome]